MSSDGATELHWSCERLGLLKMGLLKMGNGCGLYEGSTEELRRRLSQCRIDAPLAMDLRDYILQCYTENESKLSELGPQYERLPCSTEVLESSFGCFKADAASSQSGDIHDASGGAADDLFELHRVRDSDAVSGGHQQAFATMVR